MDTIVINENPEILLFPNSIPLSVAVWGSITGDISLQLDLQAEFDTKEPSLGNPLTDGYILSSTALGVRSWVPGGGGSVNFIDSIQNVAGNVSLVGDTLTPGNLKYYGTDSGGTKGFFNLPTGGGSTFLSLTDTPSSYSGQTLKAVRVNAGETALEFYTPTFS